MKLYTEEQVRELLSNMLLTTEQVESMFEELTPIEPPSDEKIAKHMTSVWFADNMHRECFKLGAIWMKTQIYNQNK